MRILFLTCKILQHMLIFEAVIEHYCMMLFKVRNNMHQTKTSVIRIPPPSKGHQQLPLGRGVAAKGNIIFYII